MLRYCDRPGADVLCQLRVLHPNDPFLADVHFNLQAEQMRRAMLSGDPFHGNSPPRGKLPAFAPGLVPIARLATGDTLSVPVEHLTRNLLLCGPTGMGKTTALRLILFSILMSSQSALVVAFDRKNGEICDCATFARAGMPLLVLKWHELAIAILQCIPGMQLNAFITTLVQLIAEVLRLQASRRLLGETLELLYRKSRPRGTWPTLSQWIDLLESIKVNSMSRLGQYREAAVCVLKQILRELPVVNCASSDMLEQLFSHRGIVVVVTSGLSVEVESFLSSVLINYAYHRREGVSVDSLTPLIFALDDAMPIVHGSSVSESEGGTNPLATWSFMGRSRKLGLIVAAQNFSAISPALRNNASTLMCFGSYGRDAEEIARHLSLTPEQAAMLPRMQPGEVVAIARSVWPLAVHGALPEVP